MHSSDSLRVMQVMLCDHFDLHENLATTKMDVMPLDLLWLVVNNKPDKIVVNKPSVASFISALDQLQAMSLITDKPMVVGMGTLGDLLVEAIPALRGKVRLMTSQSDPEPRTQRALEVRPPLKKPWLLCRGLGHKIIIKKDKDAIVAAIKALVDARLNGENLQPNIPGWFQNRGTVITAWMPTGMINELVLVGFIAFNREQRGPQSEEVHTEWVHLYAYGVAEEVEGRGLGHDLLEAFFQTLSQQGENVPILADIRDNNTHSRGALDNAAKRHNRKETGGRVVDNVELGKLGVLKRYFYVMNDNLDS